jgi:glutamine amidotransferase
VVPVTLIDYGSGNTHSAAKALSRMGGAVSLSGDPDLVSRSERIVLPGVGAFASCRARLQARDGLVPALVDAVGRGAPFLGICVGMQLLATRGLEHGETEGLDLIPGTVRKLETGALKSPHMGWNEVRPRGHALLPEGGDAYFVHSYCFEPEDEGDVAATCDYAETFPALVARGNVAGTQFHPEKSQGYGLALLERFLGWRP